MAFLSEPVKGKPRWGGWLASDSESMSSILDLQGAGPSTIMHEAPYTEKLYHIVSDFSRCCRKIVRLYNEIVEFMLAARYRNRSISPFNSVPIMHISKCDFATFWHIHSDNLLVQSAVSRFWGIPPCEFCENLREALRRSLYNQATEILIPPGASE